MALTPKEKEKLDLLALYLSKAPAPVEVPSASSSLEYIFLCIIYSDFKDKYDELKAKE